MEGDLIFVNIDPVFNIALHALKELADQGRLRVTNVQCSKLKDGVKSDTDDDANKYIFGGKTATLKGSSALMFGRTASSVFRMVMLDAVQIDRGIWPKLGKNSDNRNKDALQFEKLLPDEGQEFKLLGDSQDKAAARQYWSAYDHAFPHFLIESKISEAKQNEKVGFRNMMLIFRNSFTEVIEITTTANARKIDLEVKCYVNVLCIRREIRSDKKNPDKAGGAFEHLKKCTQKVNTNDSYLEDIMETMNLENKTIDDDWQEQFNKVLFHESKTESKTPDEENTDITREAFEHTQQDDNRINESSESSKSIKDEGD